ncbi:MAG: holo-ACP synthase [Turicibacter sp.]
MIIGIGTDIIELDRIRNSNHPERFIERILSEKERVIFSTFKSHKRQIEFLAGRFAVKEALYKALGAVCNGKEFNEFSVLNDEFGAPFLETPHIKGVHISISHCENYATAFVIYENSQDLG